MRLTAIAAVLTLAITATPRSAQAQEPYAWRDSLVFHTFSIAAIDPRTGEVGVAVTTRVPCVGNGVPWVRKGVGAVATQASTRTEYGNELLDALARGEAPDAALKRALADVSRLENLPISYRDIVPRQDLTPWAWGAALLLVLGLLVGKLLELKSWR